MVAESTPFDPKVVQRHAEFVRRVARTLTRDLQNADDLEQDAWVVALERPTFVRSWRAWFGTVLRNRAGRTTRTRERRERRERRAARGEATRSTLDAVAEMELVRDVLDAVDSLGSGQREVIVLRYLEALPPREIASRLDVDLETVKARLKRGLAALRSDLVARHGDDPRACFGALLALGSVRAGSGLPSGASSAASGAGGGSGPVIVGSAIGVAACALVFVAYIGSRGSNDDANDLRETRVAARAVVEGQVSLPVEAEPVSTVVEFLLDAEDPAFADPSIEVGASAESGVVETGLEFPAESSSQRPAGASSTESRPPGSVVRGRVIAAGTREPVAAARVAFGFRAGDDTLHRCRAISGADGTFEVTTEPMPEAEVPESVFGMSPYRVRGTVRVTHPDFAVHRDDSWPNRRAFPILPEVGDVLDLGALTLHVGTRVRGRVITFEGNPVADAALFLGVGHPNGAESLLQRSHPVGRSDSDGAFVLTERIRRASPYAVLFAITDDGLGWGEMRFPEHRLEASVDVVLRPSGRLEVDVRDESGQPVAGATVIAVARFSPLGSERAGTAFERREATRSLFCKTTDDSGRAQFRRLAIDGEMADYTLWCAAEGFTAITDRRVALTPFGERKLALTLARLRHGRVEGRVTGPDSAPVADARIHTGSHETVSDADGWFLLEGLDPAHGPVSIRAEAAGFTHFGTSVALSSTEDASDVEIRMEDAAPIAGVVVDSEGWPIARAQVHFIQNRDLDRVALPDDPWTDAQGRFACDRTTVGSWGARLFLPDPPAGWRWGRHRLLDDVVEGGDRDARIIVERLRTGEAVVDLDIVDAGGMPVDPVEVQMILHADERPSGGYRTSLGELADGRATVRDVCAGLWTAWVTAEGYPICRVDIDIPSDAARVSSRIVMGPAGVLHGRVVDADGEPAVDARVHFAPVGPAWIPDGDVAGPIELAEDASFERALPPGGYVVSVAAGARVVERVVEVPCGGTFEIVVEVESDG